MGAVVSENAPAAEVRTNLPLLASMVLPTSAEANEPEPRVNFLGIVYWSIVFAPSSAIYIFVPSGLNVIPCALSLFVFIAKLIESYDAVDTSNAVRLY